MSVDAPFLTDLQFAVMRVLWDRGRATAAEITEALRPDRRLAQTTIATILSRLEKRGVVDHDTAGRQYTFFPLIDEAAATRSMVAELTERIFDGDVTALMTHLISAKQFSRNDLAKVKALIARHESAKEPTR